MDWRIKASAFLLLCVFFGSCKTAEFHHEQIDVHGMVYDLENRPVGGFTVALDGKHSAVTDAMGRYAFASVPAGDYALSGYGAGWEQYESMVSVNSRTTVQYLRVASAEELLDLADAAIGSGDIGAAREYLARAEKTGSPSFLIPYYAAVAAFRGGSPEDSLAILTGMEAAGVRDPSVSRMRRDMLALTGGSHDEAQ